MNYILWIMNYILYIIYYILWIIYYTLYVICYILYVRYYLWYIVDHKSYMVYDIWYMIYDILYIIYYILYIVYRILYIVYIILYYTILCIYIYIYVGHTPLTIRSGYAAVLIQLQRLHQGSHVVTALHPSQHLHLSEVAEKSTGIWMIDLWNMAGILVDVYRGLYVYMAGIWLIPGIWWFSETGGNWLENKKQNWKWKWCSSFTTWNESEYVRYQPQNQQGHGFDDSTGFWFLDTSTGYGSKPW